MRPWQTWYTSRHILVTAEWMYTWLFFGFNASVSTEDFIQDINDDTAENVGDDTTIDWNLVSAGRWHLNCGNIDHESRGWKSISNNRYCLNNDIILWRVQWVKTFLFDKNLNFLLWSNRRSLVSENWKLYRHYNITAPKE